MATREKGYALCVENRGAEDLEIREVYRVLHDKGAADWRLRCSPRPLSAAVRRTRGTRERA